MTTISFRKRNAITIITGVSLTFLIGLFIGSIREERKYNKFLSETVQIRQNTTDLQYINPLLGVSSPPSTNINILNPVKDRLQSIIQLEEDKGTIDDAAIYFRDLNSTFWFGIDEDTNFVTASLFKLPIALAAYRQNEDDPNFFKRKVYYTSALAQLNDPNQGAATSSLVVGQGYFVKDLISKMLIDSDNGAKDLLMATVPKNYLEDVFSFSALLEPDFKRQYILSPKNFSIFFRILYSATYLSNKDSNELLQTLSRTTFSEGIADGVDSSVKVSHKFGVYVINKATGNAPGEEELHDCGIIYHPRHPYILCVMTKGNSDANLRSFITEISKSVYENIGNDYDK